MAAHQKKENGILFKRFMSPINKFGIKKRIYVQCPKEYNTTAMLQKLVREAIDRHMEGKFTTSDSFGSYVSERFIDEYAAAKNLVDDSKDQLRYLLEKLASPAIGPTPLAMVDAGVVGRMLAKLREKTKADGSRHYSDRTLNLVVIAIVGVLKWAARLGDIPAKPEIPIPKVAKYRRPEPYTSSEAQKTIDAAPNERERAVLMLLFETGMRESEVLGLQWPQIDFEKKVITIDRQLRNHVVRHTKSKRPRWVPMSTQLIKALKRILHMRSAFVICHDGSDPRFESGLPYSDAWIKNVIRRTRETTGLRHVRVHDARHHFATRCSNAGMNAFDVQALLGHSDIRTTMDYVHPTPSTPPSVFEGTGQ